MSRNREPGEASHRIEVVEPARLRLDRYLAQHLPLSRTQAATLIEAGRVRISGRIPKKSDIPEPGDLITVEIPPAQPLAAVAEDIPIEIVYEDEGFVVVNKPAGMVVHPAPGHGRGTLVNALLHRLDRLSTIGGSRRPGVVHRLDKDTSGLIIVAKEETVHRRLIRALARRDIQRRYLTASWGHLRQDRMRIEASVGRHPRDRQRMGVIPGARAAITEVERLERWRAADYLRVRLQTGRTHQIRVHLHHIGHPVVGDRRYGEGWERGLEATVGGWARELARRVERQFLHAAELELEHPISGELLRLSAPLPADLSEAVTWARETS